MQLKAGYILEGLPEFFIGQERENVIKLSRNLSYFDLETEDILTPKSDISQLYVLNRMLSRATPAPAPTFIEDILSTTFLKTRKKLFEDNSFKYQAVNDDIKEEIYRALHLIDPRVRLEDLREIYKFENDPEQYQKQSLLFDLIPQKINEYFVQLLSVDRDVRSILENYDPRTIYKYRNLPFIDEKIDFTLELPYEINDQKGIGIEVEKKLLDNSDPDLLFKKNELLNNIHWPQIVYLRQLDFDTGNPDITPLVEFSYSRYFDILQTNYERPLYKTAAGIVALQVALTPFEVARVQKTILQYIMAGKLSLDAEVWNIAVIERDVPGAFLAVQELKNSFDHLAVLSGSDMSFPEINLTVYYDENFEEAELHSLFIGDKFPIEEFDSQAEFDLLIDSSLLRYKGLDKEDIQTAAKHKVRLRSVRYTEKTPDIPTAEKINYAKFYPIRKEDSKKQKKIYKQRREAVNYFTKNLFRIQELSKDQFKFLSKALEGDNSILNAPYTLRKSLLMQIVAMLQPGISVIVAPTPILLLDIKSKFDKHGIDTIVLIEGIYKDYFKYKIEEESFLSLQSNIVFVSAEQFHLPRFRNLVKSVKHKGARFSYLLIDEVNSISPWSHTFNLAYAGLPKARNILEDNENITVLGFTSTASYDVKSDLQTALDIDNDNIVEFVPDFSNIDIKLHNLGDSKLLTVKELAKVDLDKVKTDYILKKELSGERTLIYSENPKDLYEQLTKYDDSIKADWFYCHPQTQLFTYDPSSSFDAYEKFASFKENETDTLIASRKVEIGLDKSDIRKIVLHDLPLTFDDFVQLISRAGRDGKKAQIDFIIHRSSVHVEDKSYLISGDVLTQVKEVKDLPYDLYKGHRILKSLEKTMRKDLLLAGELLNDMSYLNETLEDSWRSRIMLKFGIWTNIEAQPPAEPTQLYVYDQEDLLGYLDLKERKTVNEAPVFKREQAEQILNFLDYEIHQLVSNPLDIFLILDKDLGNELGTGIVRKLATLQEGETTTVNVEFYNNNFSRILEMIPGNHSLNLPELIHLYNNTGGFDDFIAKISEYTDDKRALKRLNRDLSVEYDKLRNFRETYRLVMFLQIVGVVDDYTLNYTNQQFILVIRKESDEVYLNNVYKYISRFVSRKKALEVFEKVPRFLGQTILEKSVNYLISFYHTYIVGKRFDSLYRLNNVIELLNKGKNDLLRQLLENYFSARMIVDLELKSEAYDDWYRYETYFMQKIGFLTDNWLHFEKATEIVMNNHPDNYVFEFLKGLATLLLSENNSEKSVEALDNLASAFTKWFKTNKPDAKEITDKLQKFYKDLERHNYELRAKIEKIFELKIFTNWLVEFNKRFIDISIEPTKTK